MAKILIVENDLQNMKLAAVILINAGYEVIEAVEAISGINLAHAYQPDLILMNIQLPGMDGLSATRMLRNDRYTTNIKIYALTEIAMQGGVEKIFAAGCDGYITKPFHHREFLKEIETALS
jgi:two-component system, cell cycle response regulator DivK